VLGPGKINITRAGFDGLNVGSGDRRGAESYMENIELKAEKSPRYRI
jgi:hypothetical protein